MIKKPNTKQLIADSIMQLMLTKSIDDISIQEIADNCGISRQTFYNHFPDKYTLVDWIYETEAIDFINLLGKDCTWYDAVLYKLNIIKLNPGFYRRVYRQEWFIKSFTDVTRRLYINAISKNVHGEMTKQLKFMIDFYVNACVKKTSDWVLNGLKETPEELVAYFLSCLPDELKKYLINNEDIKEVKNSILKQTNNNQQ